MDSPLIVSTPLTSFASQYDFSVQIVGRPTGNISQGYPAVASAEVLLVTKTPDTNWSLLASAPYSDFTRSYDSLCLRYEVAKKVVFGLRRKGKYMDLYLDYVQGGISKEDFDKSADLLAVSPRSIDQVSMLSECQMVMDLVGESTLDANELSVMLDLDTIEIENILSAREHQPKSIDTDKSR